MSGATSKAWRLRLHLGTQTQVNAWRIKAMTVEPKNVSPHYLGTRGRSYYQKGFGPQKHEGRLLQAEYFRPYCGDALVLLDFGSADGLFPRCGVGQN